jgi:Thiamine-binding protein
VKLCIPGLRWQHACRFLNYTTPLGTGEDVGEIVAEAVRVVRESGLPNRTDVMSTNIVCLAHCWH